MQLPIKRSQVQLLDRTVVGFFLQEKRKDEIKSVQFLTSNKKIYTLKLSLKESMYIYKKNEYSQGADITKSGYCRFQVRKGDQK